MKCEALNGGRGIYEPLHCLVDCKVSTNVAYLYRLYTLSTHIHECAGTFLRVKP